LIGEELGPNFEGGFPWPNPLSMIAYGRSFNPFFPLPNPFGYDTLAKRKPDRNILSGILFVLQTGITWEYLPLEMGCGSGMTRWRRLRVQPTQSRLQCGPRVGLPYHIVSEDYERAAGMFNDCRKKGIQGSQVDFLICAVSVNHGLEIFTLDKDFRHYGKVLDIILHTPRGAA
jgi:transposase